MKNIVLLAMLLTLIVQGQIVRLNTKKTQQKTQKPDIAPSTSVQKQSPIIKKQTSTITSTTVTSKISLKPSLNYNFNNFNNLDSVYQFSPQQSYRPARPSVPSTPTPISGEVAGIILSLHNGYSYDQLFSRVEQQSKQGSVVLTYVGQASADQYILQALKGNFQNSDQYVREFIGEVEKLEKKCPSCIVFNWECSSGYGGESFGDEKQKQRLFELLGIVIKRGWMAMFSDFSLKALIKNWNTTVLGPNPFVKVGQTNQVIKMRFKKEDLLASPSSQLQAVAKLADKQQVSIRVLGGTIQYAVDYNRPNTDAYQLKVLTIAQNFRAPSENLKSQIDKYTGLACHVLLSFKQGGKILTSMGHWIQLMKIDTSEQKLFQVTEQLYGKDKSAQYKDQYSKLNTLQQKRTYISQKSRNFIQNQSPGTNNIYFQEQKQSNIGV